MFDHTEDDNWMPQAGKALVERSIEILKKQGFEALQEQVDRNCPVLAQARWFIQNDPSKLSTCWSQSYTTFMGYYFWRWDGELPRPKVPIFLDRFHVWQWVKCGFKKNTEKLRAKLLVGWL